MIAIFVTFIAFVSLSAIVEYFEKKAIQNSQVTSLPETDFAVPKITVFAKGALFIAVCLVFLVTLLGYLSFTTAILAGAILLLTRIGMFLQITTAAMLTAPLRLLGAFDLPEFAGAKSAFYFSGTDHKDAWHFHMWEEYLKRSDPNLLLILRERSHFKKECKRNSTVAIYLPNNKALSLVKDRLKERLSAVFYANNSMHNSSVIRLVDEVSHVQLLHGDSDKPPSFHPTAKLYDFLFVAGQMAIDRYRIHDVEIPRERFRIVGRPQVDAIETTQTRSINGSKTVVYMPTWRGFFDDTQFSSLANAAQIVEGILGAGQNITLHFKPHPLSYKDPQWPKFEKEIRQALSTSRDDNSIGVYCKKDTSPFDLYNLADALVTDISSVMIDFLYSGKPFAVVTPTGLSNEEGVEFPSLAACYQINDNLSDVVEAFFDDDVKATERLAVREYAFGDFGRTPGEAFREACDEIIRRCNKED